MLRITPVVGRLGRLFADAGHELYLVGGSVRDALLGQLGHDLDLTTSARPDDIERLLRGFGSAVWTVGKAFGTIGCKVEAAVPGAGVEEWVVEVTTFRSDAYRSDSRKPEVSFGDSLTEDLVRRDFRINAMAIDVTVPGGTFVDPHDGLDDLAAGVIRTPGTAEQSFSDDPLRMMRAARFASQLGFTVSEDVAAAMTAMADRIEIISAERVRDELTKLLLTSSPRAGLDLLVRTGIADRVLPELPALRLERDEHHRHKDVYQHSLTVLEQAIDLEHRLERRPDLVNRLAALLHDIGKPATRRFEPGGKVSFHHHDVVGAKLTRKRMKELRFSAEETKAVSRLVELHLRFHGYRDGQWTDSAVRRYVRDAGDQLERLHILTRADCTTRNQRKAARLRQAYDDLERRIGELAEQEELEAIRPDLDGNQIMALLGLPPGREVGEAYRHLLDYRMEHGPATPEEAEAELRRWWAERSA
ncbi:CCA tRNA nucleotidyltransferase [Desertihabitans aurantiacus]|uniref:CCA tRNA nucleotidyltransferase n=1 Tax=Desertihabitans aurantiacus TaxID=2282477 RepID=UPI000DF7780A|nr:CCA tRNA nucleotidyltransferase [Desertihabitans aurantiacus]